MYGWDVERDGECVLTVRSGSRHDSCGYWCGHCYFGTCMGKDQLSMSDLINGK